MTITAIQELPNARKATGGYGHYLAVSSNGALYGWGLNEDYQVGNGSNSYVENPIQIGTETDWVDVACGDYHSLGLKSNGDVYAWGRNVEQQCGIDGGGRITTPTKITFSETVVVNKISACGNYSLFADTLNLKKVYGCGINSNYLLSSTNLNGTISTPTHMPDFDNATLIATGPELCGVAKNNVLVVRGVYDFSYENILSDTYSPIAKTSSGTVPNGNSTVNYNDLCIGNKFLLALKQDRTLWGYTFGDLSYGSSLPANSSLGIYGVQYRTNSGNYYPQNNILTQINDSINFRKIECGTEHVLLLDENNKLYSWGGNKFGQLGRETTEENDTNIVEITSPSGIWSNVGCGNYSSLTILQ